MLSFENYYAPIMRLPGILLLLLCTNISIVERERECESERASERASERELKHGNMIPSMSVRGVVVLDCTLHTQMQY